MNSAGIEAILLQVRLLGNFKVKSDGQPVEIPLRAAQSLLAYLMLNPGTPQRREHLAGLFWPDMPDAKAKSNLRQTLSRLRKAIGEQYLVADDLTIAFEASTDYWLDAQVLTRKIEAKASFTDLIEAVSVYGGELLPGFYDDWVLLERERLQVAFDHKVDLLLDQLIKAQRWEEVLEWSERWIALGHTPEAAYRALILAYGARGDVSNAAIVYQRCEEALRRDLGVEPSPQTHAALERARHEAATSIDLLPKRPHTNLPAPLSSFIGRERAIDEIKRRLWSTRLLTLTGPGGCGKTRLALQVASDLLDAFSDGVWLVELAPLSDAALIPRSIMTVLDMHEQTGRTLTEALIEQLQHRELLLVLDNCEHLIDGCADLVVNLLQHCSGLRILATSREALNIAGEIAWPVPPLSMIDPKRSVNTAALQTSEATCLFLDRATAAQADFVVSDQDAPAIAQICNRLDGMPLAIELAAARIKMLAVDQIAARLDDRFNLLSMGSRTAPARHQTLHAMIDWSYGLLSATEKNLFRRTAVFAGSWTLEAAEAVCVNETLSANEVLPALSHLVDKSIVIADQARGEARYRLLETIRQYAHEKLVEAGELDRTRERHLDYFIGWAEAAEFYMTTAEQLAWLNRYEADHDNLRAALDWCQAHEHQSEAGLRLAVACGHFWYRRGYASEGRVRLTAALTRPGAQPRTAARARALSKLAALMYLQSDFPAMRQVGEEALSIWRELGQAGQAGVADVLDMFGDMATEEGDYGRAAVFLQEAMQLFRELNDIAGIAHTYMLLGWAAMRSGDYPLAASHLEEFLTLSRQVGDASEVASALSGLGEVAIRQGQYERAVPLLEQGLALYREHDHKWGIGAVLGSLGWVALLQSDFKRTRELLGESLSLRLEIGDKGGMAWCLEKLAEAAHLQGRPETAVKVFGAAAALRAPIGSTIDLVDRPNYERIIAELRSTLGERAFTASWATGEAWSLQEAIDQASADPGEPIKPTATTDKEKYRGLTAREREVAALIAQGKANREIAEAMTVGVKTVETYVTRILNKLGFDNRVQIATWAVNKGLALPGSSS